MYLSISLSLYIYIYIYTYICSQAWTTTPTPSRAATSCASSRTARTTPGLQGMCLNSEALQGMFPWRYQRCA